MYRDAEKSLLVLILHGDRDERAGAHRIVEQTHPSTASLGEKELVIRPRNKRNGGRELYRGPPRERIHPELLRARGKGEEHDKE